MQIIQAVILLPIQKIGEFSDKLYYGSSINSAGDLINETYFPQDGLNITDNRSYYFVLKNNSGQVLARSSIAIDKLVTGNIDINVNIDIPTYSVSTLYHNYAMLSVNYTQMYNDLYYYYSTSGDGDVTSSLNFDDNAIKNNWTQIGNEDKVYFYYQIPKDNLDGCNYTVKFELRNRLTNKVVNTLTRTFKLYPMGGNSDTPDGSNPGSGDNSLGIPNTGFQSIDDIMNWVKGSLDTINAMFSILPFWIWAIVSAGLVLVIILRVLGR